MAEYLLNISDGSQNKREFPVIIDKKWMSESTFTVTTENLEQVIRMLAFCLCSLANRVRFYISLQIRREHE